MNNKKLTGIYGYFDTLKYKIIYIGKDSNIEKKVRHKAHYSPSQYNVQQINRVLQNDKVGRYKYVEFDKGYYYDDTLNKKEIYWISYFEPLFNFTRGGDGVSGYEPSLEHRKKISEALTGEKCYWYGKTGDKHPRYNKPLSEETCKKISESLKGRTLTEKHCKNIGKSKKGEKNPYYGKNGKDHPTWKPYARVVKDGFTNGKQRYALYYNGKRIKNSINKKKLLEEAYKINKKGDVK